MIVYVLAGWCCPFIKQTITLIINFRFNGMILSLHLHVLVDNSNSFQIQLGVHFLGYSSSFPHNNNIRLKTVFTIK